MQLLNINAQHNVDKSIFVYLYGEQSHQYTDGESQQTKAHSPCPLLHRQGGGARKLSTESNDEKLQYDSDDNHKTENRILVKSRKDVQVIEN